MLSTAQRIEDQIAKLQQSMMSTAKPVDEDKCTCSPDPDEEGPCPVHDPPWWTNVVGKTDEQATDNADDTEAEYDPFAELPTASSCTDDTAPPVVSSKPDDAAGPVGSDPDEHDIAPPVGSSEPDHADEQHEFSDDDDDDIGEACIYPESGEPSLAYATPTHIVRSESKKRIC